MIPLSHGGERSRRGLASRKSGPSVLISAPGAGLGHLVRACGVAIELMRLGVGVRILTHSVYAEGMARITGCPIDCVPTRRWVSAVPQYVDRLRPRLVVLDTFPWGIRGEWAEVRRRSQEIILLARRLNVWNYLRATRLVWDPESPTLRRVIVTEPLSPAYQILLERSGSELHRLSGRICFPHNTVSVRVPARLVETLQAGPTWLLVHSGPRDEVDRLADLARRDSNGREDARIVAIMPDASRGSLPGTKVAAFELFPASLLFPYAHRVVTGAGYNCMAEMGPWRAKHLCHAFPRRYDDQRARLAEALSSPLHPADSGARDAACTIASFL